MPSYTLAFISSVLLALLHQRSAHQMCKETKHGVDSGLVRVPDFQEHVPLNVSCDFSYSAQPGKRLLVKVDSVHLPPSDIRETTLKLILDDAVIDIPRNCVRNCLKQIASGRFIQILYTSSLLVPVDDATLSDTGSFQIRYKSFDPSLCDKPRSPQNGLVTILGRKLGQEAKYICKQPYELVGKSRAVCQVPSDTPVPDWSQGPPRCVVPNCTVGIPFLRKAGSGAISSPGYPSYRIESRQQCEWIITAEKGYQIASYITFLGLKGQGTSIGLLRLYDGQEKTLLGEFKTSDEAVQNRTTLSNVLMISFITSNNGVAESGFFLEYSAIPGACKEPERPEFGETVGYSFGVGSNIAFRCDDGYVLEGNSTSECKDDGTWSSETPVCLPTNASLLANAILEDYGTVISSSDVLEKLRTDKGVSNTSALPPVDVIELLTDKLGRNSTEATVMTKISKPTKKYKLAFKASTVSTPKSNEAVHSSNHSTMTSEVIKGNKSDDVSQASSNGLSPKDKSEKPQPARGSKMHHSPNEIGHEAEEKHSNLLPKPAQPKDKQKNESESSSVMMYTIIGSSVAGLLFIIAIVTALVVYRKRFPVRMRFGRKFSTFENPMYSVSKEQDSQHPRELKRLNPT